MPHLLPLLLSLLPLWGCGSSTALHRPPASSLAAIRPELTAELVTQAWRENARYDSLRMARMQALASGVEQSFVGQIKQVQK